MIKTERTRARTTRISIRH